MHAVWVEGTREAHEGIGLEGLLQHDDPPPGASAFTVGHSGSSMDPRPGGG